MKKFLAVLLIMILCVGCGTAETKQQPADQNESSVQSSANEDQTGYPGGEVQMMYVMVNEKLYKYSELRYDNVNEFFITDDERYEFYGAVKKEDNKNMPVNDLEASRIHAGANVYINKNDNESVVVFEDNTVYYMTLEKQ